MTMCPGARREEIHGMHKILRLMCGVREVTGGCLLIKLLAEVGKFP